MSKIIHIAPAYLHYDLQKEIIKNTNSLIICDISFLDMHTFLNKFCLDESNSINNQIEIGNIIKNIPNSLFTSLIDHPSFISELYNILETFQLNNSDYQLLNDDKMITSELKVLLNKIGHIKTKGYYLKHAYNKIKESNDFNNVLIYNFYPTNRLEKAIYEHLLTHGAKVISSAVEVKESTYYYSLNKRMEIESVAQRIVELVNNKVDINDIGIMIASNSEYENMLAFVFKRYNIPYYLLNNKIACDIDNFLNVMLAYFQKPCIDTFKAMITNTFIKFEHTAQTISYIDALNIPFENIFKPFDYYNALLGSPFLIKENEIILKSYEDKANECQAQYNAFLMEINTNDTLRFIDSIYNYLINNNIPVSKNDISYFNQFKNNIIKSLDALNSLSFKEAIVYLISILDKCKIKKERTTNVVLISDLDHLLPRKKYGFGIGLHQKAYPNFVSMSGILNENTILEIAGFLSLEERYDMHINKMQEHLSFATNMTFFYPQSNFEGKVYERSLDLELAFKLSIPLPYITLENNNINMINHTLSTNAARLLFFKDNKAYGSISSFERYFNCPYAYFLKSGLKLKTPFKLSIQEGEIGTLQHAFLEEIVKKYHESYINISSNEIDAFINDQFSKYMEVFTNKAITLNQIKKQIKANLQAVILKLKDLEAHTSFKPTHSEYHFDTPLLKYKDIELHLSGIVDRIDEISHGYRIIDYKSSNKKFELSKFNAGLALQLPTYAYIINNDLKKQLMGFYYYSLKINNINQVAYQIKRPVKKGEPYIIEEVSYKDCINNIPSTKLTGKTFADNVSDLGLLDDTYGTFISDIVPGNKDELADGIFAKVSKPLDFNNLCDDLLNMYTYLIDQLIEGDIKCAPRVGACTYCDYSLVCKFKGSPSKLKPILNKNIVLEAQED